MKIPRRFRKISNLTGCESRVTLSRRMTAHEDYTYEL
jgi:hypothetical protein